MNQPIRLHKNLLIEISLLLSASFSIILGKIDIFKLLLSVAGHELGHIISAFLCGAKTKHFSVHGFGVEISFPGKTPSNRKMFLIALGGPLASLILTYIGFTIKNYILFSSNLAILLINLIPAYPLDGGKILYSLLSPHLTRKKLYNTLKISGKVFGTVITFFGILLLFVSGFNISLIYMGLFIFFSSGRLNNPVAEVYTSEIQVMQKSNIFKIDSSLSPLDIANNLPVNSIGAITDKNGKITDLVTPLYLYNKSIEKSHP